VPSDIGLDKLDAAIADIGEELQKIKANRLLSAGQKLLKERVCKRERRKLELRVKLFHQKRLIERLEGEARSQELFRMSPLAQAVAQWEQKTAESRAEKRRQKLLAGQALGAGGPFSPFRRAQKDVFTPPDPDPAAAASIALTKAREQHAAISRELEELCSNEVDEANGNARSAPSLKSARGRKSNPEMVKAKADIHDILDSRKEASAKDVCDELTKRKKPCPYAETWDEALAKYPEAVNTLISRTKKDFQTTQPLQPR
jgi:hypothetical protein